MSWDAGAITGSLGLNVSEYAHGMLQAEGLARAFPPIVTEFLENPLIGFISLLKEAVRGIFEAFESVPERFHEIGLAAKNLGVSTEFISGVGAVAKISGVSIDELGMSLKFLQQRGADALAGEQAAAKGFSDLGIKADELATLLKEPEKLFYRVAQGISSIPEPAARVQAATDLMSRSGFRMIALFEQGPEKIRALANELNDLGAGVSAGEAAMGEKWGEMEAMFDAAWMGIKKAVAEPIMQLVIDNADEIKQVLKDVVGLVRDLIPIVLPFLKNVADILHIILQATHAILGDSHQMMGSAAMAATGLTGAAQGYTDSQSFAGGGGSGGVNIQNVNVGPVDADHATSQIAAKLQPTIRQAVMDQYRQLSAAYQHTKVASKLGGNAPSHYHSGL